MTTDMFTFQNSLTIKFCNRNAFIILFFFLLGKFKPYRKTLHKPRNKQPTPKPLTLLGVHRKFPRYYIPFHFPFLFRQILLLLTSTSYFNSIFVLIVENFPQNSINILPSVNIFFPFSFKFVDSGSRACVFFPLCEICSFT